MRSSVRKNVHFVARAPEGVLCAAIAVVLLAGSADSRDPAADGPEETPVLSGDYLGRTPPGSTPQLFAPGVVSTGLYERDIAMTPDGDEIYFGLMTGGEVMIVGVKRENGVWSAPGIAPCCDDPRVFDLEPCIAPDGRRFLFLSTRPRGGEEPKPGWDNQDIWAMDRTASGWGEPYHLGPPVDTDAPEFFPSLTRGGTLYFTREVTADGGERSVILRARMVDGTYTEPEILPKEVNPGDHQFNAFIDPDERYLIVGIAEREGNIGASDYYVCFRREDDSWKGPVNMGALVNTPENRVVSPYVSPDGKYFFFASNRGRETSTPEVRRSYEAIQRMASEPQNGSSDVYWVDASFIARLRP